MDISKRFSLIIQLYSINLRARLNPAEGWFLPAGRISDTPDLVYLQCISSCCQ